MTNVHDGDRLLARRAQVLDHVFDEHAALGDLALCWCVSYSRSAVRALSSALPVTISTLSELTSLTLCSPSEDMMSVLFE